MALFFIETYILIKTAFKDKAMAIMQSIDYKMHKILS